MLPASTLDVPRLVPYDLIRGRFTMPEIPRYLTWMEQTRGGLLDSRSSLAQVDEAVRLYELGGRPEPELRAAIRTALDAYLEDYLRRKGKPATGAGGSIRDRRGALTQLKAAVAPAVLPPAIDVPIEPPKPKPTPPSPPPGPAIGRVRVEDRFRSQLEANLAKHQRFVSDRDVQTSLRNESLARVSTAVTHAYTRLVEVKSDVKSNLGLTFSRYNQALDKGMASFEAAYNQNSEDIDFKVGLMKGAFEALTHAPFPLSIIGSAGVTVMEQLKTERMDIQKVDAPRLTRSNGLFDQAIGTITEASEAYDEIRTLSVSPSNWKSRGEAQTDFDRFHRRLMIKFESDWESVKARFEAGDAEAQKLVDAQIRLTASSRLNEFQARSIVEQLKTETDAVKRQFEPLASVKTATFDIDRVGRWIAVLFVADYALNGLLGQRDPTTLDADTLGGTSLSDPFAALLEAAGLLEVKMSGDGRDTSAAIYAKGQIPWVSGGHTTHLVAVYFFLHWARKNVNPFLCITRPEHLETVDRAAGQFIQRLGIAIEANKTSRTFRHATADAAAVAGSLTF